MKTITELKRQKPLYYVCIEGSNLFESESLTECKNFLANYIKSNKNIINDDNCFEYFIGMYNIDIM